MRTIHVISTAMLLLGGVAIGCKPSEPPSSPAPAPITPTTMSVPETNGKLPMPTTMSVPSAAQTEVVLPAGPPPAAKDLTHVLTADEPFFLNEPGADPKPVGILKAGTKVLVMIPGAMYSQVVTEKGITCFTVADGLKPLGK